MKLEDQLATLAALGLTLAPGITIDDLLFSWDRKSYEEKAFDRILFVLGCTVERKPWGRHICLSVWNFDTECVEGNGAYVRIVTELARVAGVSKRVSKVTDEIEMESAEGWVEYTFDGTVRREAVEIRDDWADLMVVSYVMDAFEESGRRFYSKDNGQSMVLFYLDEVTAARINELSSGALTPAVPK